MKIEIPINYYQYIQMLVEANICRDENAALLWVFDTGLDEGEFDASYIGAPDFLSDVSDFLQGEKMTIEIPVEPEQHKRLELISKVYRFPISKTATVIFIQGLGEFYLHLKGSSLYSSDEFFRWKVDNMPHDPCYDDSDEVMSGDEDEDVDEDLE